MYVLSLPELLSWKAGFDHPCLSGLMFDLSPICFTDQWPDCPVSRYPLAINPRLVFVLAPLPERESN